ncbi:MAG: 2,3-bisphosphoglycerate-independent phosphoglycerate mutase [Granulosicoccaceae bacterium]
MTVSKAPRRPALLIVMDGIGHNPSRLNNAVAQARTPNLDRLYSSHPLTVLEASGRAAGLPDGQMGNSEVGHLTLGCGAILRQDLVRINAACRDGELAENSALQEALAVCTTTGRPLHLLGLVSDGGVHSHIDHLMALVAIAGQMGVKPVVHMITDGRDTAPRCAAAYLDELEAALAAANGQIATVIGRFYAMDRDQRWERVEKAWRLMVRGEGFEAASAREAIESAYANDLGDEFIEASKTADFVAMEPEDQVVFFNFRNDRPRELTEALAKSNFDGFDRGDENTQVTVTCMTRYDSTYPFPVIFEKERPQTTIGEAVSALGLKQFRCAETEKYPHVTFFLNGQRDLPFEGEDREMIPSPKVATYDLQPEMSGFEVCEATKRAIESEEYSLLVVNFANGDMVGHTGVPAACVKAVEVVDQCVGVLVQAAQEHGVSVIVTADHGNCDQLKDPITGEPHTQHTTYPVPCLVIDPANPTLANAMGISNIAPTLLQLMGVPKPAKMPEESIILGALD